MPLLVLIVVAVSAGLAASLAAWRYPRVAAGSPAPAFDTARKAGEAAARHPGLRAALGPRLDPETATGLALTLALIASIGGGVGLGLLAYLERTNAALNRVDRSVAGWGHDHASSFSTHALDLVTQLGATLIVVVLCVLVGAVELVRTRTVWIVPYLVVLMAGEGLITTAVKDLANRARPAFNPAAAALGPSFPSSHTSTAAAFYAGAALLLGRRRSHWARAALTGLAVGIAVAVASSRVLLDVHWLSDVIAGLLLGWAWFAVCGIAFGGRLLRFGAPARVARVAVNAEPSAPRR
jgi:membrane-associated phospholipid phosphatase